LSFDGFPSAFLQKHSMMARKKPRVDVSGGSGLSHNPFGDLDALGLPEASTDVPVQASGQTTPPPRPRSRGRVDIIRQKAHRGGKTVTVLTGFVGIGLAEKESMARELQKSCGVGGTVKDGHIEIQGDQREKAMDFLRSAGFRPVLAGG
jgi:translation initiation factor 1